MVVYDGSGCHVYYAENTGSGWNPQRVSTGTSINNRAPQIALDRDGNPHVVWRGYDQSAKSSSAGVCYAENTGGGWSPQLVPTSGFNPHFALDPAGDPHVVWDGSDGSAKQIYYAENTGGGWNPQLVSTGTSTSNSSPQIALDRDGNPNVVWCGNDGSTDQVYYSVKGR